MWLCHRGMSPKDADRKANSVDPDQTAPQGAVWSWSTLLAQTCLSKNEDHYGNLITLSQQCTNKLSVVMLCFKLIYKGQQPHLEKKKGTTTFEEENYNTAQNSKYSRSYWKRPAGIFPAYKNKKMEFYWLMSGIFALSLIIFLLLIFLL